MSFPGLPWNAVSGFLIRNAWLQVTEHRSHCSHSSVQSLKIPAEWNYKEGKGRCFGFVHKVIKIWKTDFYQHFYPKEPPWGRKEKNVELHSRAIKQNLKHSYGYNLHRLVAALPPCSWSQRKSHFNFNLCSSSIDSISKIIQDWHH